MTAAIARNHARPWRTADDLALRMAWGTIRITQVARDLGRTEGAVARRAFQIGLGSGCPQGFERLCVAEKRTGLHRNTLQRALHLSHVHIRPLSTPTRADARQTDVIVEPHDVDAAVAHWCSLETLKQAERRLGYAACTIARALAQSAARGEIELPRRARNTHWRLEPAVIDKAMASRFSTEKEGAMRAARRVGVSWRTMKAWLRQAGIHRPATHDWVVDRAVIDQLVAAKRAAGAKAFRFSKATKGV